MSRIFIYLAWFALIFMAATLVLGLSLGDLRDHPSSETRAWATVHRLSGVATSLAVVFVNSIVVTYFIGTSRWCKEVAETYRLDPQLVAKSTRLKRKTFPWAVMSMLTVVGVLALGGAADPGTGHPGTENWTLPHLWGAMLGLAFIGWSFVVEWNNLSANQSVISEILAAVKQIRVERGLDVE